jgi:hypothetical protein
MDVTAIVAGVGINVFTDWFAKYGDKTKKQHEIHQLITVTLRDEKPQFETITQQFLEYLKQAIKNSDEDYTVQLDKLLVKPKFPLYLPPKKAVKTGRLTWQDFRYDFELTGFQGRADEQAFLTRFLKDDSPLSWTLIYGRGGSGKSRLALELCRSNPQWHSGFFAKEHQDIHLLVASHRFDKDTLIVVDYAADRADQVKGLLEAIANIQDDNPMPFKARVLLIERQWYENINWYKNYETKFPALLAATRFETHCCQLNPLSADKSTIANGASKRLITWLRNLLGISGIPLN